MKKTTLKRWIALLAFCCLFMTKGFSQGVPDGIIFQALAKDPSGIPAKNRIVHIKDAIIQSTANGPVVYSESFVITASDDGVFTITIGKGTRASGVNKLTDIDWNAGPFFLNIKAAIEPTIATPEWKADEQYVDMGTSQFWTVPFAFSAAKVAGIELLLKAADTTAMLNPYLRKIDTASLSNRIEQLLKFKDTSNMLAAYLRKLDTAIMLAPYLRKTDMLALADLIDGKLNIADTTAMFSNYLRKSDISSLSMVGGPDGTKLNISDTLAMLSGYLRKLDTALMLNPYLKKSDTAELSNRIDAKLSAVDTTSLSNRIDAKLNAADTSSLSNRINAKLNAADTASLSNRINAKMNRSDTVTLSNRINAKLGRTDTISLSNRINAMNLRLTSLADSLAAQAGGTASSFDTTSLSNRINAKLNRTDTASLSNRIDGKLNGTDTLSLSNRIDGKLNGTDTLSLSNRIDGKLNGTDTLSLSNRIDGKLNGTDTLSLSNRIDGKLNGTDTLSLSNRIDGKLNGTDTLSLSNRIDGKLNGTDTLSLSNRIDSKLNAVDTLSLSNRIDAAATPDATDLVKGKIQLAGDLAGTADAPVVADGKITTTKIADSAVNFSKIQNVGAQKIIGNPAATTGTVTGITLGVGLSLSGDTLNVVSGTGGGGETFTSDITVYSTNGLGKYSQGQTIPAIGKTAAQVLIDALTQTIPPSYSQPSAGVGGSPSAGTYEIGTPLNITLSSSFNQNDAGAQTSVSFSKNGSGLGSNTDNIASLTSAVSYTATVSYGQGPIKNNNLGAPDPTGRINAGSKTSGSITYTPQAKRYWGISATPTPSDAEIIAATGGGSELNPAKAKGSFNITISSGTYYIFFAYPASQGALSSLSVGGFGSLPAFTLTAKSFTNAQGYAQSYNVYVGQNTFSTTVSNIITN